MKRLITAALLSSAVLAFAQATPKKELVQKLLTLQQPGIEQVARGLVERPAMQMMQEAGMVLQRQIPPEKREALGLNRGRDRRIAFPGPESDDAKGLQLEHGRALRVSDHSLIRSRSAFGRDAGVWCRLYEAPPRGRTRQLPGAGSLQRLT